MLEYPKERLELEKQLEEYEEQKELQEYNAGEILNILEEKSGEHYKDVAL